MIGADYSGDWGITALTGDGGDSGGSSDDEDPNAGTEFGTEGDDYYGQSELDDLYTPTLDDPAIDDGGFQGEDSWMDYQKDEDGAGSRYDRGDSTNWMEDAALQFDTETVDELTVPDLDFTEMQQEVFSERGQTLDGTDDADPDPTGGSDPPAETLPSSWPQSWRPPSDGLDTSTLALGAAAIVAVGAIAYVGGQS